MTIHGTNQAFDEAYYRHANKRLRLFRGDTHIPEFLKIICLLI